MAESKPAELAAEIKSLLGNLHREEDEKATPPHVELIDFDRMTQLMQAAQTLLEAESHAVIELELIRTWMMSKIEGRSKALSFLHDKIEGKFDAGNLTEMPAEQLIAKFEESARALGKFTTGRTAAHLNSNSNLGKYSTFKS